MENYYLKIKVTTSRARDTYGWNIVTLWDDDVRYSTKGGGYDMFGTVIGDWLFTKYKNRLISNVIPVDYDKDVQDEKASYGFFHKNGKFWLDGACGFECMKHIASLIGVEVSSNYNRRRNVTEGCFITDKEGEGV